ncbi:TPA: family 78 glycoside hydrolase catalytic domain [Yersinia enterocolitica]|nr:family 78 glycoside hydrolase catalytic domain [Yersinia enterocolitica]HDL6898274.1 family 78 glycoside hydrolase catalytic domain [Yersinia enterocolitica]HDL8241621.1 family 78 glycoside hydrolase catalytic domain [Yersinia enterocolitica]HDL8421620.1 family 78 glycoside hydrolase catalytic domain [Yersinia enterocolitica]HEN3299360.1 family 78 glycoside hydrolase catalytic domain [Yersinia enterocolitica]
MHFPKLFRLSPIMLMMLIPLGARAVPQNQPSDLRLELQKQPLLVEDLSGFSMSWVLNSTQRNDVQTAYRILVSTSPDFIDTNGNINAPKLLWDSGKTHTSDSSGVTYHGPHLSAATRYYWVVQTWNPQDEASPFSSISHFDTALKDNWHAIPVWVAQNTEKKTQEDDWAFFRKHFKTKNKDIQRAIIYATGTDPVESRQYVYKVNLNGNFAGLGPVRGFNGKTFYNAFDVSQEIKSGQDNAISASAFSYGDKKSFMAELRIDYTDGDVQIIATDESWKSLAGNDAFPYAGDVHDSEATSWVGFRYPHENIDAKNYPSGFQNISFNDSEWQPVAIKPALKDLIGYPAENLIRRNITPVIIKKTANGQFILDYGVTIVGGMSLAIDMGNKSSKVVTIKAGEILKDSDNVKWQTAALINNNDKWALKSGPQSIEHFGFRVFRYAQISGLPDFVTEQNIQNYLTTFTLQYPFDDKASSFSSSNAQLNRIWAFSRDSIKNLNHDLYVDSPNRERAPYEADTYIQQLSNYSLSTDYALARFSVDWLTHNSTWPMEWKIYNILNSWNDYLYTGDRKLIAKNYSLLQSKIPSKLLDGFNPKTGLVTARYGDGGPGQDNDIVDWPKKLRDEYKFSDTHNVTNVFFYAGTKALSEIASVLNKTADSQKYTALYKQSRNGIQKTFFDRQHHAFKDNINGEFHISSQANSFVTSLGAASPDQSVKAAKYLASQEMLKGSVYSALFALTTMAEHGQAEEAINQITGMNSDGTPRNNSHNWRHMMELGSGSTMEAWNESDDFTVSHSHPWGTAPSIFIPESIFGIKPLEPAWAEFQVKPARAGLTSASVKVPMVRGEISASYETVNGKWRLNVTVPVNTKAFIYIPTDNITSVKESGSALKTVSDLKIIGREDGYIKVLAGSGKYSFSVEK